MNYPYLPDGRTIQYVNEDNIFMSEAFKETREHSTDDKQPTGAVIVKDGKIIGRGSNQTALQNPTLKKFHENGWCVRKLLNIQTGEKYWLCPGCSGYDLHAEAQAIGNARKQKNDPTGADLYLWGHWWCCKPCWDKMIEAGIKDVYLLTGSEVYFNRSNNENRLGRQKFDLFQKQ